MTFIILTRISTKWPLFPDVFLRNTTRRQRSRGGAVPSPIILTHSCNQIVWLLHYSATTLNILSYTSWNQDHRVSQHAAQHLSWYRPCFCCTMPFWSSQVFRNSLKNSPHCPQNFRKVKLCTYMGTVECYRPKKFCRLWTHSGKDIWGQIFKLPPSSQNPIISPILTYCVRTTMPQNLTTSGYAM